MDALTSYINIFSRLCGRRVRRPVADGVVDAANSITMLRVYSKNEKAADTNNVCVEKVDAVLDYMCNLDAARHLKMDVRYSLNNDQEIALTPHLKAKITQKQVRGEDTHIELTVYSATLKISEIRAWIDDIHANYVTEKNNKLGNKLYYFNEVPHEPLVVADMRAPVREGAAPPTSYKWSSMPKQLTFTMNEFNTSKRFSNVYGAHIAELKERLDLFINHPEWYAERGIPYSLGVLLHGVPGGGKTSTIKAIAKDTHRHIFNLSLRAFTTQKQLLNLFYNENVTVQTADDSMVTLKIPLNRRVYVIEDIDCLTDVVLDRRLVAAAASQDDTGAGAAASPGEGITLSFLLNLLDGVLETPGRILVITSNYPEKLDRALVRPGRIDVNIEFTYASREFIKEMFDRFYNVSHALDAIPDVLGGIFTPAEVMESMCAHYKASDAALRHLVKKADSRNGTSLDVLVGGPTLEIAESSCDAPEAVPQIVEAAAKAVIVVHRTIMDVWPNMIAEPIAATWQCECTEPLACATCEPYIAQQKQKDVAYTKQCLDDHEQMTNDIQPPDYFTAAADDDAEGPSGVATFKPTPSLDELFEVEEKEPFDESSFNVMDRFNELLAARQ